MPTVRLPVRLLATAASCHLLLSAACAEELPDLQKLVGATVDVKLTTDKTWGAAKVEKVLPGTTPGSIRSLTIKPVDPPRPQIIAGQYVAEIFRNGEPLDVVYDKKLRELAHSPDKRRARLEHRAKVEDRLRAKRARFWEEISEEDQAKYVAEEKDFLEKTRQMMGLDMQMLETKYYLFYTDMPLNTVGVYVQYLDQMYENMTKAFDFPKGKNIWRGKCAIVAFQKSSDFHRFEREVMNNPNSDGAQGVCHSSTSGRVIMACYKGADEAFFAVILVHETSHGFMHRYKSTIHVPPWINEGVADWVAGTVVGKLDDEVQRRQRDAISRVSQSGTLGGTFFRDDADLDRWQYGLASSFVELLLRIDPKKYRKLIDNVKEGMESEEALQDAYGFGFVELTRRYGALAQVPNLQP